MFEKILSAIKEADTVIIHRHTKPDGDAMGSQIGLKHILKKNFPEKKIYAVGDHAGSYSFIADSEMDVIPDSTYEGALAVILDCGSAALISDTRYTLAANRVRIDHHILSSPIVELEVIDPGFESCCGMITAFAEESALELDSVAAAALYTGMVTDSGRFRYDSTSSRTFHLASLLMQHNIDTNEIYRALYADDFSAKKLKAQFVLKIRFTEAGVAYIYTTKEEFLALNTDVFTVSRGMVGTMGDIRGVDIWANFTETDSGVLCEIRSARYNINPVAVKYGGGGHAKASGATVPNRETAMAMLRDLDLITTGGIL